jgi:DNA-binding CsgD family transcriptional regulator
MTNDLYLSLIQNKMYVGISLISISYVIGWFFILKLNFLILKVKIAKKELFPMIFAMTLYTFFVRQFLPIMINILIEVAILTLFTMLSGKTSFLKSCWTAMIVIASTAVAVVILGPLCYFNSNINNFLINSNYGLIVGSFAENIGPLLLISLLLKKPNFSLIPPIITNRYDFYDIVGLVTYGSMFSILSFFTMQLIYSLKTNSRQTFTYLILLWIASVANISGHISIVNALKRRFESQLLKVEKEKAELEKREAILQQEKVVIAKEKAILEQEKSALEAEKFDLLTKVQEFKDSPGNVEYIPIQQFQDLMTETIYKIQTLNKTIHSIAYQQKAQELSDNTELVPSDLTSQERMILKGLGSGLVYKEIAAELHVVEGTVKNWAGALMKKLGLKNQLQLASYAGEHGLIDKGEKIINNDSITDRA